MKHLEIQLPGTDLRAVVAAIWYEAGSVSQEVAAEIAGMTRSEFVSVLSGMGISPLQESVDEVLAGAELFRQP